MKNFDLFKIRLPLCWRLSYTPHRLTCPEIELEISFKVFKPIFSINDISKLLKFKSKSKLGFSLIAITVPSDSRVIFSFFSNFKSIEYESKSVFPKALISKSPISYSLILISSIEASILSVLFVSLLFKFILDAILPEIGFLFISKKFWINKFDSSKFKSISFSLL